MLDSPEQPSIRRPEDVAPHQERTKVRGTLVIAPPSSDISCNSGRVCYLDLGRATVQVETYNERVHWDFSLPGTLDGSGGVAEPGRSNPKWEIPAIMAQARLLRFS